MLLVLVFCFVRFWHKISYQILRFHSESLCFWCDIICVCHCRHNIKLAMAVSTTLTVTTKYCVYITEAQYRQRRSRHWPRAAGTTFCPKYVSFIIISSPIYHHHIITSLYRPIVLFCFVLFRFFCTAYRKVIAATNHHIQKISITWTNV